MKNRSALDSQYEKALSECIEIAQANTYPLTGNDMVKGRHNRREVIFETHKASLMLTNVITEFVDLVNDEDCLYSAAYSYGLTSWWFTCGHIAKNFKHVSGNIDYFRNTFEPIETKIVLE